LGCSRVEPGDSVVRRVLIDEAERCKQLQAIAKASAGSCRAVGRKIVPIVPAASLMSYTSSASASERLCHVISPFCSQDIADHHFA